MTLSLCMITKNEESVLKQCLLNVKDLVDEIIIVDSHSTDATCDIAKEFNAKIIQHKWTNSFSDARNVGLRYAKRSWILVLDADEIISSKDHNAIRSLLKAPEHVLGYLFEQRDYTDDTTVFEWQPVSGKYTEEKNYTGYAPVKIIRLFRNHPKIYFTGAVHEGVDQSIKELGGHINDSSIPIHHFQKERGEDFIKKKQLRYFDLLKKNIEQDPTNPKHYNDLGIIYRQFLNNPQQALNHFRKAINLDAHYTAAYTNLAKLMFDFGKVNDAIRVLSVCLEKNPKYADGHFNVAGLFELINNHSKAKEHYTLALKYGFAQKEIIKKKIEDKN